jgi:hypothetical protein
MIRAQSKVNGTDENRAGRGFGLSEKLWLGNQVDEKLLRNPEENSPPQTLAKAPAGAARGN